MPGCGMHSRPNLAEKARYNSLLRIEYVCTKIKCLSVVMNIISF